MATNASNSYFNCILHSNIKMYELQCNLNVFKTFDFRMKDGPTCTWNQHRTVEFQNSGRDAHNPFSTIWEPVCLKAKRAETP
jgi:hypothetical protein